MQNPLSRFLRAVAVTLLALIGATMAFIFMASTALALGLLYIVARVRGKPFGVRAYWQQRLGGRPGGAPFTADSPFTGRGGASPFSTGPRPARFPASRGDVTDVEAREVH